MTTHDPTEDEDVGVVHLRPFADILREIRRGDLHDELSSALQELVQACQQTGKKGTLTIKLAIEPDGQVLLITDDYDGKLPKPERSSSIFYADDDANLVRNDPRQQKLGLREADPPATRKAAQ